MAARESNAKLSVEDELKNEERASGWITDEVDSD